MPLPPTRYINPGPMTAPANPAPAMAAGRALEGFGQAVSQVADQQFSILEKVRQVKEAGAMNAFMANLDEEAGRFAIELAQRHDTDNWPGEWKQRVDDMRQRAKGLGLSPEAMAKLDNQFTSWSSQRSISFETQAATKALGMARMQTTTALEYYAGRGDREGFGRTMETAEWMSPAEKEKGWMEFDRQTAVQDLQREIRENPQAALEAMEEPGFLESRKNLTYSALEQARAKAKSEVKVQSRDQAELALDEFHAGRLELDDLRTDPRFSRIRPSVLTYLEGVMQEQQTAEFKQLVGTPEYQAKLYGEISAALSSYNEADEGSSLLLAQIDVAMRSLGTGFNKDRLREQYDAIKKNGQLPEAKTYGDFTLSQMDALYKNGHYGKEMAPGKIKVLDLVERGFLKDTEKHQKLGFSESQAEEIKKAAAKDPALGQKKFIDLWDKRPKGSVAASEFDKATADALLRGRPTIPWDSVSGEAAANQANFDRQQRFGIDRMKMAEFLRLTPNADKKAIDEKYLEITGQALIEQERERRVPPRPQRGGGGNNGGFVPGETSMNLPSPLAPLRADFIKHGIQNGLDPRFLAAIAMHETANGNSSAFKNKNNAMGVSNASGPIAFSTAGDSIARMARLLGSTNSGPYKSATTIAEIGRIYAPPGAGNDPGKLNSHWVAGVSKFYKQLGGDPKALIKSLG